MQHNLHFAAADSIAIGENRQRREFPQEAHEELMRSISTKGLMNPPTMRIREDGTLQLVAGERRLKAIRALHEAKIAFSCNGHLVPEGAVPFLKLNDLDPIEIEEAELEENVIRKDLTIPEQIAARKRLFDMRKAKAQAEGRSYSSVDFAEELQRSGVSESSVRTVAKQLSVAQHLDTPAVQKAKTMGEALKASQRETEKFLLEALASEMDKVGAPPEHQFIQGDCRDILRSWPSGEFDCICTDPPYGIDIQDAGSMVHNAHHYSDSPEVLRELLAVLPEELYRVARPSAHLYWFCDPRWFTEIRGRLIDAGWDVWYRPIIWRKKGKGMVPDMHRWPRQTTEWIVYGIKGSLAPLRVADDCIETSYSADLQQAEKPRELYTELLSRSVLEGAKVIDPCCGAGVIFDAARELKLHAVGIELDPTRGNLAKVRSAGSL